ncbi:MAG: dolichyl-phosphate beta-glucosyltransferase [Acidobacteriota bacterium]
MFLSIVIPAYNEEQRLGDSLSQIEKFLAAKDFESEVLIVNDGSQDRTTKVASDYIAQYKQNGITLRVIENPGNRGKGYSVRNGMLNTQGEIALFTDADLSAPITEADRLIAPIVAGEYDVVFGSRALAESFISTHQSTLREVAGRTFNLLMHTITGLDFKDTQCGFKAFRMPDARGVFERQRIQGFGFDVEVLYIAKKHGLRLLELPVVWGHMEGSRVNFLNGLLAFSDLLTIRWNDICRRYTPLPVASKADAVTMP